jgi:glycosyltransferase involved in cell wall biosynthesis
MKVAIVCDWLVGIGGAERIVREVHRMYPEAPIYTSQYDPKKIDWFKDADVRTGWLQKLPASLKKFMPLLRAWYFSHLNLSEYDLVITVNFGAESKAVKTGPNTTHICYCNAPTHYYWSRFEDYIKHPGFGIWDPLARLGLKLLVGPMRRWDYKAAQKPDYIIANSSHIQAEIKKYYHRGSEVIHPPVDVERFADIKAKKRQGFIVVGRQTPYKKIDLAVAACTRLGYSLKVVGNGPDHDKLVRMAGQYVKFDTEASDKDVAEYFASAEGCIFPNLDDFGITPVEAMAAGTPVIAYKAGGALDYVVPGKSGAFFKNQTVPSLAKALRNFKPEKYSSGDIKKHAKSFSRENFQKNLSEYVDKAIQ